MSAPSLLFEPDFVVDSVSLYKALVREVAWDERMRARKAACRARAE